MPSAASSSLLDHIIAHFCCCLGTICGLSDLLLFLLFSDVIGDWGFSWYIDYFWGKKKTKNKHHKKPSKKPQTTQRITAAHMQEKSQISSISITLLRSIKTRCWPLNIMPAYTHWMEASCATPPKRTETLKLAHFRERIKGCFFRCCSCTLNPSVRHCSLSLLNTYIAEVPRGLM